MKISIYAAFIRIHEARTRHGPDRTGISGRSPGSGRGESRFESNSREIQLQRESDSILNQPEHRKWIKHSDGVWGKIRSAWRTRRPKYRFVHPRNIGPNLTEHGVSCSELYRNDERDLFPGSWSNLTTLKCTRLTANNRLNTIERRLLHPGPTEQVIVQIISQHDLL